MKRIITAILVVMMGITCLVGCESNTSSAVSSAGKGVRIYVSLSESDTFRNTLLDAAKQTAAANGAEIVVYDAENTIENQVAHIRQAVNEKYDVIMCAPVDADTAQELEAIAGDIPIVFYNSCPDESVLEAGKYMYVGSDETVAGQYQAEYIMEKLGSKSEINAMILKGTKSHSASKGRLEGVKNTFALSGKKVNYVFEDYANWDEKTAQDYFNIFRRTGQKIDVVLCQNDTMALGVIKALKENNITGVAVLGIDATADGCAAIEKGDMDFTVYQSAKGQGEMAVKAAIALGSGNSVKGMEGVSEDGCYIWVPFEKVDRSNVSQYK